MATDSRPGEDFWVGDWFVRPRLSRIEHGDMQVHVTPRAMAVLVYLANADGAVVSRIDILDAVWPHMEVSQDALTQCIVELRKAFGDTPKHSRIIETIPKVGLRLICPVIAARGTSGTIERPSGRSNGSSVGERAVTGEMVAGSRQGDSAPRPWYSLFVPVVLAVGFVGAGITGVQYWNKAQDRQEESSSIATRAQRLTIAVLPFSLDSATDDDLQFFANGIQDELISQLATTGALDKVISRTSVMDYRDTNKSVRQIGEELGVRTVLEGHLRRAGNRVHLNVRLVDSLSGSLLWTGSYDSEPTVDQVFHVQSDIALSIARALQTTMTSTDSGRLGRQPTRNTKAYQFYLSGREYARGSDLLRDLPAAVQQFERATGLDPDFALAFAYLSMTHIHMYWTMDPSDGRREQAWSTVQRALEIRPDLPEAHLAKAWYHYQGHLDYDAALRELAIAEPGMPDDAEFWFARGAVYRRMGRWLQAVASLERAVELDPRNANLLRNLASSYSMLRHYEQADRALDRVLEVAPNAVEAKIQKASIPKLRDGDDSALSEAIRDNPLLRRGQRTLTEWHIALRSRRYDEALRVLDEWDDELIYESRLVYKLKASAYGIVYHLAGRPELSRSQFEIARRKLEQAVAARPDDPRLLISLAEAMVGLGEPGEGERLALEALALMPPSREAMDGPAYQVQAIVRVLAPAGAAGTVTDQLEAYLSAPGFWSIEGLLRDPRFDSVRDDPEFLALVEQYRRR